MKTLGKIGLVLGLGAGIAAAETYNGKLLDETCYDAKPKAEQSHEQIAKTCAPTAVTTRFAIRVSDGKVYKLDSTGNAEVSKDLRSGVIKPDKDGDVHASLTGSVSEGTVKVDLVNVSK